MLKMSLYPCHSDTVCTSNCVASNCSILSESNENVSYVSRYPDCGNKPEPPECLL